MSNAIVPFEEVAQIGKAMVDSEYFADSKNAAQAIVKVMAGRDREKSASYYTPEVLTECVVKYSLKELLKDKSAADILKLTICEPAMGSGAFINEALNQLATGLQGCRD